MEEVATRTGNRRFFYGWDIVGAGFFANVASAFALASTLSIFLKPLTADLTVSRGVFSLLRSGEGLIGAAIAPLVGQLVDRYGGRWLLSIGTVTVGVGYLLLGYVESFTQFVVVRLTFVTLGDALMGSMIINIVIAQWFLRRRGRALAFSSMGVGFAKVCMPIVAASLIVWLGWRHTWMVFGLAAVILGVVPVAIIRRSPEEMGLLPDGVREPNASDDTVVKKKKLPSDQIADQNLVWTRGEVMRTSTFWLLVITFGIASMGVTGLNLHVYPYVTDLGHPPVIAATVMSVIASMQLASPLPWGLLAERMDVRIAAVARFVIQAIGLGLAISTTNICLSLCGFLSLWHRFRGQYGFARDSLGKLLWSSFPGHGAWLGHPHLPGVGGGGAAFFWFFVRSYTWLWSVVCDFWFCFNYLGIFESYAAAATKTDNDK